MIVLIINCLRIGMLPRQKFTEMEEALRLGGYNTLFTQVSTKDELISAIHAIDHDIIFCDASYISDGRKAYSTHGIFEEYKKLYVGSPSDVLDLVLTKSALKAHLEKANVLTPGYFVVRYKNSRMIQGRFEINHARNYPYLLKPDCEGNSRGITPTSIVRSKNELLAKLKELEFNYGDILCEEYLGRYPDIVEYTVAFIGNGNNSRIMPAQLVVNVEQKDHLITNVLKDGHFTRAEKIKDDTRLMEVISFAQTIFNLTDIRDYGRCDIIFANKQLFFIEINGQPMIPDKWFEACAEFAGLGKNEYINEILNAAILRNTNG